MPRSGFTLIEVLVALFVGAFIVEGSRRLTEALADTRSAIRHEAFLLDERANAQMTARALVRQLYAGTVVGDAVVAHEGSVTFSSFCETARGWNERCRVSLSLEPELPDARLMIHLESGIAFDSKFADVTGPLLYLSGDSREWKLQPGDRLAAIGVARTRDTLLLPVGARW